jgi:hypothetical protein
MLLGASSHTIAIWVWVPGGGLATGPAPPRGSDYATELSRSAGTSGSFEGDEVAGFGELGELGVGEQSLVGFPV